MVPPFFEHQGRLAHLPQHPIGGFFRGSLCPAFHFGHDLGCPLIRLFANFPQDGLAAPSQKVVEVILEVVRAARYAFIERLVELDAVV